MKRTLWGALLLATLLSTQQAMAWGGWAHRLVAYIAEAHLTPEAKATAEKYLGSSIVEHAVWMDRVPVWNKRKNRIPGWEQTSWWHMCTVDKVGKKGYKISDKRGSNGDGDLYPNLVKCVENLKNYRNLTDSAVTINLKCILHMVGDMHCPSHIYFTEFEDCFARRIDGKYHRRHDQMQIYYEGKKTTSHKVWDGMSIREIWPEYGTELELFRAALDNVPAKKREKMCRGTIEEWVLQNAKDIRYIYDDITPGVELNREYLLKNQKLSKTQCLRSAYRLAHILNECLK